jgi:uncharacterized protein (TIGR02246 family)
MRWAIVDLVQAYARAVDAREPRAVAGCFADDGVLEADGVLVQGRAALLEFYERSFASSLLASGVSTHFMGNIAVVPDTRGDVATVDTDAIVVLLSTHGGSLALRGIHYRDECVWRPAEAQWQLTHRRHRLI